MRQSRILPMKPSAEQIDCFMQLFAGRPDVRGTHDPVTGRAWQVKAPVTRQVVADHLDGRQPFGVYPLKGDKTAFLVVDFDKNECEQPAEFVRRLASLGVSAYVERSKSKGFHVWLFFETDVLAWKPRRIVRHILADMHIPETEVFPKQDRLDSATSYGNFINCPLYGGYLPERCVFVDNKFKPYPDQYEFLKTVRRISDAEVDAAILKIGLPIEAVAGHESNVSTRDRNIENTDRTFGLKPCARRMLAEGVTANQRVAVFRLAVQLRKTGLPFEAAVAVLIPWAKRNRPENGKAIIADWEIRQQTEAAYRKQYASCGCDDEAIKPFCDQKCELWQRRMRNGIVAKAGV